MKAMTFIQRQRSIILKALTFLLALSTFSSGQANNTIVTKAAKIVAATYDYTQKDESYKVINNGKFHQGLILTSKPLNKVQQAALNAAVNGNHQMTKQAKCFDPHHGFVFYNEKNEIIGHLSVCLICKTSELVAPQRFGNQYDWKALEALLKDLKMPILKSSKAYTLEFKKRKVN